MQLEVVTSITDWMEGVSAPGKGVNDFLPAIPGVAGAGYASGAAAPPVAVFGDPYRDAQVAKWEEPPRYPALYFTPDGPVQLQGELSPQVRGSIVPMSVAVRYLARPGEDQRKAAAAAHYTIRAALQSLVWWLEDDDVGRAARERNGIYVESCASVTWGPWQETVGQGHAIAVLALELRVRDALARVNPV